MQQPNVGDNVDNKMAIKLCKYYGLNYLVDRITIHSDSFLYGNLMAHQ